MKSLVPLLCSLSLTTLTTQAVTIANNDLNDNQYTFSDSFTGFTGGADPVHWTTSNDDPGTSSWQGTNNGSSTTGGKYAYGNSGDGATFDGSLGFLPTGDHAINADISFTNNSGQAIVAFTVSYLGVHWRSVLNGRTNGWTAFYAIDGGAFTALDNLTYTAPNNLATGAGPHGSQFLEQTIDGLFVADGSTLTFRFFGDNGSGSGSRQGVAIDDFSLNATLTPEPSVGLLALLGTFIACLQRRRPAGSRFKT